MNYTEIEKDLFKVKKINFVDNNHSATQCIGIVVPNIRFIYVDDAMRKSDILVDVISLKTGNTYSVDITNKHFKISSTRITDPAMKKLSKEVISLSKQKYKCQMAALKEYEQKNKLSKDISTLIRAQESDGLSEDEFYVSLWKLTQETPDIRLDIDASEGIVKSISLNKIYTLGKYINNGDFSFLYLEYDDVVFPVPDYEKDKSYQNIVSRVFKKLNKNSIDGFNVSEDITLNGGGDKRSASISQTIEVSFDKKPFAITKENLEKAYKILSEIIKTIC